MVLARDATGPLRRLHAVKGVVDETGHRCPDGSAIPTVTSGDTDTPEAQRSTSRRAGGTVRTAPPPVVVSRGTLAGVIRNPRAGPPYLRHSARSF